jgi:hypothetical protein
VSTPFPWSRRKCVAARAGTKPQPVAANNAVVEKASVSRAAPLASALRNISVARQALLHGQVLTRQGRLSVRGSRVTRLSPSACGDGWS